MAYGDLTVNTEGLGDRGQRVVTQAQEVLDLASRVRATNSELANYWKGADYETYKSSSDIELNKIEALANEIISTGNNMQTSATNYAETEASNASRLS